MSEQKFKQIVDHWVNVIIQHGAAVDKGALRKIDLPQELASQLNQAFTDALESEVAKLLDSDFISPELRTDDSTSVGVRLRELLSEVIVLPKHLIHDTVEEYYQPLLEKWQMNPIPFREASENPDGLALEIFKRAASLVVPAEEDNTFEISVLSEICELSGLPTLALALQVEGEIGYEKLDLKDLTLLTKRLLKLKEHYQVGRKLSYSLGVSATMKSEPAAVQTVEQEDVTSEITPTQIDVPIEETPVQGEEPEAVASIQAETKPEPAQAEVATTAEPIVLPEDIPETAAKLYSVLMEPENLKFFSDELFDENINDYKLTMMKICRQKKLKNAYIVADNELFIREKSQTFPPTMKLVDIVREYFVEIED